MLTLWWHPQWAAGEGEEPSGSPPAVSIGSAWAAIWEEGVWADGVWASDGPAPTPPVADFTASPLSGDAPLTVDFSDASSNTPTSWLWDFGDSTTSTAQHPSKIYATPGTYTVELTATNGDGSDVHTAVITVLEAGDPLPAPSGDAITDILRVRRHRMRGKGGR
jgi:PKD repeat protein